MPGGLFGRQAVLKALDGVSFSLRRGRIVGESGCGKSTTAGLSIDLIPPTSGRTLLDGEPIAGTDDARWRRQRRDMQMVFQDPLSALDRRIPVGRQVMEPLLIHGLGDRAEREARARAVLGNVGLQPHHFDRYPHELSGGQRQRVVLARALTLNPSVLVCDEPVSALDVSIQAQVLNLLERLQAEFDLAYLFISHDLKVVRQISHDVAVMYLGRIVEQGPPKRLFEQPEHPYTRMLVDAVPAVLGGGRRFRRRIQPRGEPPNPIDVPTGCPFRPRCPLAQQLCMAERPTLERLPDGQLVACHAAHGRIPGPLARTA
nr:oligopeptide/dipeptide ABC transporter ATP-binding protein [Amaricoccus macauensis]